MLHRPANFYITIVARLPTAALVLDRDGTVRYANPAARMLFGDRCIDVPFAVLFHDRARCEAFVRSIAGGAGSAATSSFEGDVAGASGSLLRLEVHAVGALDQAGFDGIVLSVIDVTSRHRREQELVGHFTTDPLTGLGNRRFILDSIRTARDAGSKGSMAIVDLDGFKQINDRHGHSAGDQVLVAIASRLLEAMPSDAAVARVGGDEFALLLPGVAPLEAERLLSDVLGRIREPIDIGGAAHVTLSLSAGITALADLPVDRMMTDCDIALYAAKARGRNQVVVFGNDVRKVIERRRELADTVVRLSTENKVLQVEARTDVLTGLPNRRALAELEGLTLATPECTWTRAAVLFIDIDHFSAYNHHYKDSGGDVALRTVAHCITKEARASDQVFRKGGEEFVALLPDIDREAAVAAAERVRGAVLALGIAHEGSDTCPWLTVTIGVGWGGPGRSIAELIGRADDQAMAAKQRNQRNAVHVDPTLD